MRFIQCVGCGYTETVELHDQSNADIRLKVEGMIDSGWRYAPDHQGFVCPSCCKNGGDKLLEAWQGKIRKSSKANSLKELLKDISYHIAMM